MKRLICAMMVIAFLAGFAKVSYASDWDVAGKVFAGIEGLRVLTGGKVDVIGSMTGINRNTREYGRDNRQAFWDRNERRHHNKHQYCSARVWVPHYKWITEYVPAHNEFDPRTGRTIFIESHTVRYHVEDGGHWEYRCENHRHG